MDVFNLRKICNFLLKSYAGFVRVSVAAAWLLPGQTLASEAGLVPDCMGGFGCAGRRDNKNDPPGKCELEHNQSPSVCLHGDVHSCAVVFTEL